MPSSCIWYVMQIKQIHTHFAHPNHASCSWQSLPAAFDYSLLLGEFRRRLQCHCSAARSMSPQRLRRISSTPLLMSQSPLPRRRLARRMCTRRSLEQRTLTPIHTASTNFVSFLPWMPQRRTRPHKSGGRFAAQTTTSSTLQRRFRMLKHCMIPTRTSSMAHGVPWRLPLAPERQSTIG
jgi:hypothetical protein